MNSTLGTDWTPDQVAQAGSTWSSVRWLASTGSTNADLAAAARAGAPSGTVLVAEHQTGGRGRLDRSWTAPPGRSLAISVLLRPDASVPVGRWLWLPLVTGIAVAEAVSGWGVAAELKWPNDVLIDQAKVCGILAERVLDEHGGAVVIGFGINTRLSAEELPVPTATSLSLAQVNLPDDQVASTLLRHLDAWLVRWAAGDDLRAELTRRCATIGRSVRVVLSPTEAVTGQAIGIDDDGRLLVNDGREIRAFAAGDVVHLR